MIYYILCFIGLIVANFLLVGLAYDRICNARFIEGRNVGRIDGLKEIEAFKYEAVTRGYAEWLIVDNYKGTTQFRWKY